LINLVIIGAKTYKQENVFLEELFLLHYMEAPQVFFLINGINLNFLFAF